MSVLTVAEPAAGPATPAAARPSASGRVWAWLRLLGGAAILGVLVWRIGGTAFLDGLRAIDGPALLLAFTIGLVTTVVSAWRWCVVARGLGIRLPLAGAVADYYRALFLNAALPGGILGDVHRAVRHGRDVGDLGRGVRAVVLERTAGQAAVVVVGLGVLVAVPSPVHALLPAAAPGLAAALSALVALVAVVWWLTRRAGAGRVGAALRRTVTEVRRGLLARTVWPGVLLASVVVLVGHVATFLIAARAAGSTAPARTLVPLLLLALLAMMLPVNVGGWGPREGVCAWAFAAAGLGAAQGLATAVVYGAFALVASLPGVAVLVLRRVRRSGRGPQRAEPGPSGYPANRSDSA